MKIKRLQPYLQSLGLAVVISVRVVILWLIDAQVKTIILYPTLYSVFLLKYQASHGLYMGQK